jgi:hypothetical protein
LVVDRDKTEISPKSVQPQIVDTNTGEFVDNMEIACEDGVKKWRIKTEKTYRYFTQKDIDSYLLRK